MPEEIFAVSWALQMEEYQKCLDAGVPFLALRYNEMNSHRARVTQALLTHCGLSPSAVSKAMQGFEKDSQEGSGIGQDNEVAGFTAENRTHFLAALAIQPNFNNPDMLLNDIYHFR